MTGEWITIGQILKPHGYCGFVKVQPMTDVSHRFSDLKRVWLEWPDSRRQEVQVEEWRSSPGVQLMKVQTIQNPEDAESLRGAYILVPRSDVPPLPEGQYYVFELIGLQVLTESGDDIGEVQDVMSLPANDVYVVQGRYGEVLIPTTRDIIVSIDLAAKRLIIRPIPGLLDHST